MTTKTRKDNVPPYPGRDPGPKGPQPCTELPVRDMPEGHHWCEGCPEGPNVDVSKLMEKDHIARCFIDCCQRFGSGDVLNPEALKLMGVVEWDGFVVELRERGLIEEKDVRPLSDPRPESLDVGLTFVSFQQWLFRQFWSDNMRRFEQASEALRSAIHSMNIHVCYRGLEDLSQKELYTYQVLLSEAEHSVAENLRETLRRLKKAQDECELKELEGMLNQGSGDAARAALLALGNTYLEGEDPGPLPTTPEEFQWKRGTEVERHLSDIRVASVAFPPREKVLFRTEWGMRRLAGRVASTERLPHKYAGAEIEVVEIPWDVPAQHSRSVENECNRMEALKQLTLSKHFRDYLGFDFSSYSGVGLHFLPNEHGISLRDLVATAGPLSEGHTLFRYWSREILTGMRDYLYQCCQELTEDLTLEHVFVAQEGLHVFFRDVPFGECRGVLYEDVPDYGPRYSWRNGFVAVENRLIWMFGNMLLELLYGREQKNTPVRTLQELSRDLKFIISMSVNARDTLDYFMLSPGGKPPVIEKGAVGADGKPAKDIQHLAGGLVAAGIDEFDSGEEYKLWWLKEHEEKVIIPNTERTADDADGGVELQENWRQDQHREKHILQWKPNAQLVTIQAMLNHPALQRSRDNSHKSPGYLSEVMEAWEVYGRRYEESRAQQGRLDRFIEGGIR